MPRIFRSPRVAEVPTVLQMEAVECGAACLAMVLGYHGRHAPLEEVRVKAGVTRDGSNAASMVAAARAYGLDAAAFRREPENLGDLSFPQILFWEFDHFVVLEGLSRGRYVINDPAVGRRILTPEEFSRAFTGVTLAFERTEAFRPEGRRPSVLGALIGELRGSQSAFFYLVALSVLLVIPGLAVPGFSRIFVDYYLVENYQSWLMPLLLGMAATAVARAVLLFVQGRLLLLLQTKLSLAASANFFWRVLRLPMQFFAQRDAAEIASRVRLANRMAGIVTGPLASGALGIISSVCYGAILILYDARLAAVAIALALGNLLLLRWVNTALADRSRRLQIAEGQAYAAGVQGLGMLDTYRASGGEHLLFQRWMAPELEALNAEQVLERRHRLVRLAPQLAESLMAVAILGFGALRVMEGSMTIGELIGFQMLAGMFSQPVTSLASLGAELQQAAGTMLRLDDLRHYPLAPAFEMGAPSGPTDDGRPTALPHPGVVRRIEVDGLRFGYSPDKPLFDGISLNIEPGAQIALVGGSGSGKSTLGKILLGLIEPWSGEVRYDGVPLTRLPPDARRGLVGYVEQAPSLFSASIRDNIALWDSVVEDRDVVEAAHAALIHEVIAARPAGYAMRLTGAGGFSGGEIQRIALARAMLGQPSVVLLDEGTSALDSLTEQQILSNLRQMGLTCILITHRTSAIRYCDEIIVLSEGRIVQRGRHGELAAAAGPYRELIDES